MMRISETVKHLLIINVIMFIGTMFIGKGILFYDWFAMHFPKNEAYQPWQILTHMFMHGGPWHLALNMFGLWMFGTPVEQVLGQKRFLFIYFSAGLGAVALQVGEYYFGFLPTFNELLASGLSESEILQMLSDGKTQGRVSVIQHNYLQEIYPFYKSTMVGASGCIMGILAAFGMMNPNAELMMIFLPIPIKAKYFIPALIAIETILGFTGQSIFGGTSIAHFAHVGGAITGFLIMWYWKKTQFNRNRWN
ncbi:rhomboid family intramembrane serine protease [Flavivirga eckloniae]|uniref:Rhomboid family intramembrane serine protease n=1 Tax=Flavivirga eckloniae TaxID=1803846 RepID=A0A2K9PMR0_9FLAO|nr:rhomboid family intramembrane serine protease [Flavivirga eckloniae]AUP78353.1 rhomboid family intramembrane serine protease [Flavivirga eckloniae]